jgi:hypothetical protein
MEEISFIESSEVLYMNEDYNLNSNQIPNFKSHEEAREWFKSQYGDRFLMRATDMKDGKRVNYYHLVKDPNVYQPYIESFANVVQHEITNMDVFKSYSTITIDENGIVQFIDPKS